MCAKPLTSRLPWEQKSRFHVTVDVSGVKKYNPLLVHIHTHARTHALTHCVDGVRSGPKADNWQEDDYRSRRRSSQQTAIITSW